MKKVRIEWCENFIKSVFKKIPFENGGVETGCFWNLAERSGLWERGTYSTPMSAALEKNLQTLKSFLMIPVLICIAYSD